MAENYPKSKLKRKKLSVKELNSEKTDGGTAKRNDSTFSHSTGTGNSEGSALPAAAAWWNTPRPPAVESLWAFALKSALPYLEEQRWDLVPDLPLPPAAPPSLKSDELRWCDLCGEVGPFPGSSRSLGSSQRDLLVQTKPAADPPDSPECPDPQTASPPALLSRTQRPSVHRWEEEEEEEEEEAAAASSSAAAGRSSVGGQRKEAGPLSRQLLTQWLKASARSPPPGEREEEQRSGAGARLHSCPMCLQMFPAGFTQMDCDGHLAQCLSETNVDVTW
ncbi:uncharacterized protein PAE49_011657 isoform 2-T2 [Odontesthes bonariensis]|uniref:uncharacterized protein LOC142390174 isoform X2 n=1 Tax=Odontesthes bonariensis TaxID=219752 RepID=UPI003F5872AD